MRTLDALTGGIVADAITVHRELGPGLLESTYEVCLSRLLGKRGFRVERQVAMPIVFEGEELEFGYRLDLLVERQVVVEVKSVAAFDKVHFAQLLTYLKFSGCEVGLLINFNVARLVDGLRRVVRGYPSTSGSLRPPLGPSA